MEICEETVTVTTTGEDASATGSASSAAMMGFLLDIDLDYHASAPNTTDVVVSDKNGNTILTVSNASTDVLVAPRVKPVDSANAAITDAHAPVPLNGALTFALAGCDALTGALVATIRYLRL